MKHNNFTENLNKNIKIKILSVLELILEKINLIYNMLIENQGVINFNLLNIINSIIDSSTIMLNNCLIETKIGRINMNNRNIIKFNIYIVNDNYIPEGITYTILNITNIYKVNILNNKLYLETCNFVNNDLNEIMINLENFKNSINKVIGDLNLL